MLLIASAGLHTNMDKVTKMILAGIDILRYNFSRRSIDENRNFIDKAREIADGLNAKIKILVDMPINKIRLGDFDIKTFAVREGEEFICKSASYSPDCNEFIPIHTTKVGEKVNLNQTITIGDGEIALQVIEIINAETLKIKILNNGIINYMKAFNTNYKPEEEKYIEEYETILERMPEIEPDYIAISYINEIINEKIKKNDCFTATSKKNPRVIIKIDNQAGVLAIKTIMEDPFYDMIMIDRGELGVNIPYERSGIVQKEIISLAKKNKKRIIVSSQILESTINHYTPIRSEILDITNMVLDGVDGIMFCKETGINSRPAYTLSVARKIIAEAEKYMQTYGAQHD